MITTAILFKESFSKQRCVVESKQSYQILESRGLTLPWSTASFDFNLYCSTLNASEYNFYFVLLMLFILLDLLMWWTLYSSIIITYQYLKVQRVVHCTTFWRKVLLEVFLRLGLLCPLILVCIIQDLTILITIYIFCYILLHFLCERLLFIYKYYISTLSSTDNRLKSDFFGAKNLTWNIIITKRTWFIWDFIFFYYESNFWEHIIKYFKGKTSVANIK